MNANPTELSSTDRFQFAETIGFGGMATVYRAFDTVAQRNVAIKVLHPHLRENSVITQHFRQEYKIAQILEHSLEHPNIIRIHNIIDTPQMLALVMELHGTHDLKEHLQNHGKMHHREVLQIANQILSALETAHALNITHQDLKPHNILWDPHTNTAKLIDFGLAQLDHTIALAPPESAMATVEYSAPEQFDDFGTDHRADLYSLAITLFELLTNTLPYRADTAAAIIQMHRDAPIADVRVFVRAVPDHIAETLLRAMAKAPEDRFENATQMRKALLRDASTGKSPTTLNLPPQSTEWDNLKTYHSTSLASSQNALRNDWNIYLPPMPRANIDNTNPKKQTQFLQTFVNLFQKHPANYHGDINLDAPQTGGGFYIAKHTDAIVKHYPALFSKDQIALQPNTQHNTWSAVPLASRLTLEQAENIRYDLGKDGIIAKAFRLNTNQPHALAATPWQRLDRWRQLPTHLNTFTLLLLIATSFATVHIANTQNIHALITLTLLAWFFLFIRVFASFALDRFAPTEDFLHPQFFNPDTYHLQFAPKPTFLQDIHATTYLQLRSPRIQNSFERIILTLLELSQTNPDTQTQTQNILTQTTTIATRITHLQQQLHHQNYPALYEQLTRIDTQIARSTDTHHTAELIQQKSTLRTLLNQIDTDRLELKTLAQQLSTIAQQLKT